MYWQLISESGRFSGIPSLPLLSKMGAPKLLPLKLYGRHHGFIDPHEI
jgi:hypothetical protein